VLRYKGAEEKSPPAAEAPAVASSGAAIPTLTKQDAGEETGGEKEVLYNPYSAAERARRVMPDASVEIVPSSGHLLVLERQEFVNQRILRFLQDL
jgi:hypothetical protein